MLHAFWLVYGLSAPESVLWTEVYVITKNSAGYIGSIKISLVSQLLTIVIMGFMENQSLKLNSIQTWYCNQQCMFKTQGVFRALLFSPTVFGCCIICIQTLWRIHCKKSIMNHGDLLTWKWCIAFDSMKSYVWKRHLSHAVKQGMKSDLVRDLKCEVGTAHLNHVESVSFE